MRRDSGWLSERAQEPAAEREVAPVRGQRLDRARRCRRAVLAVGVESHDRFGALLQRELDAGLQRRALAEIDRMVHHNRRRRSAAAPVPSGEPSSTTTTR